MGRELSTRINSCLYVFMTIFAQRFIIVSYSVAISNLCDDKVRASSVWCNFGSIPEFFKKLMFIIREPLESGNVWGHSKSFSARVYYDNYATNDNLFINHLTVLFIFCLQQTARHSSSTGPRFSFRAPEQSTGWTAPHVCMLCVSPHRCL